MLHFGKSAVKSLKMIFQGIQTVEIERGPHLLGNGLDGNFLTVELVPMVLKIVHAASSRWNNFRNIT
jgi:hypothetical protein